MCSKLFIFREFYFLISESNVRLHIHLSELLYTKIKESRINEHKKRTIYIFYLIIIFLQDFLKSLKKKKRLSIIFKLYM